MTTFKVGDIVTPINASLNEHHFETGKLVKDQHYTVSHVSLNGRNIYVTGSGSFMSRRFKLANAKPTKPRPPLVGVTLTEEIINDLVTSYIRVGLRLPGTVTSLSKSGNTYSVVLA